MTHMSHIGLKKLYEEIQQIPGKECVDIPRTERTPQIILDRSGQKASIQFIGRSLPDDARSFYRPILEWIEDYFSNPNDTTVISFNLEYFNTSSSKMLLQIIRKFRELEEKNKKVTIEWHYLEDDEDILESGETFQELTDIQFDFISYQ